ncbi:S10 family peptidase [Sphingobacterium psychroaquaticum]|uniref:Carboxypeptidase C (Cathepsin A) n=1 Tax=Sphingobacterium psychroaquaticum TaxID=561061 RepID=A0A1X7KL78_9SPHI|nr:carboxypeptidase [Sphingobacterium psychroaquaticum]QBQ40458.1 carboxypeptidase [Sphingobacterium psychroaquaticum]SMG42206.1 Carboxypeptidase C (cathepsin A) [Sphingobacterium psychroaquaticum]
MKFRFLFMFLVLSGYGTVSMAQRVPEADSAVTTKHQVSSGGQRFAYTAKTGTQPVWDDKGKVLAAVNYTYYTRDDVRDLGKRPLVISFNGGPGSASVWMQLAYTGPRLLNIDDEGYPVQPYGFKENPYTILDVADIIYVNPVNTGYSRILDDKADRTLFFGTNADIRYLAEWLNTFVTRHNRWTSPKYLIGESYGTTRVSGLALELQNAQWMYLNGVILVSPTDLGIKREGAIEKALRLPYFTAAAWYHQQLSPQLQGRDLEDLLTEVEAFTLDKVLPAIARGYSINPGEKAAIIEKMSAYTSLSTTVIAQHNLDISTSFFWKELMRSEGFTVGRLDSRYLGLDLKDGGERPDYNAELTSWLHSFTPAINYYMMNELGYKTDVKYNMFGSVHPWDRSNDNTGASLRQAMAANPYLHVMVQAGYYDGATDYFNAKYNMWQMDPSGKLANRMSFKGYRSGHMMYLRKDDLMQATKDIRDFIRASTPKEGQPAKY